MWSPLAQSNSSSLSDVRLMNEWRQKQLVTKRMNDFDRQELLLHRSLAVCRWFDRQGFHSPAAAPRRRFLSSFRCAVVDRVKRGTVVRCAYWLTVTSCLVGIHSSEPVTGYIPGWLAPHLQLESSSHSQSNRPAVIYAHWLRKIGLSRPAVSVIHQAVGLRYQTGR